jgi:hypothetical protein
MVTTLGVHLYFEGVIFKFLDSSSRTKIKLKVRIILRITLIYVVYKLKNYTNFRNLESLFSENEKNENFVIFRGFFCILGIKIIELATFVYLDQGIS